MVDCWLGEKNAMLGYVTIPRAEYESLIREVQRGIGVCGRAAALRVALNALRPHFKEGKIVEDLKRAVEQCDEFERLRVELFALERRLREFDQEITPVRPPSHSDIKAAFSNSVEFARGTKKP